MTATENPQIGAVSLDDWLAEDDVPFELMDDRDERLERLNTLLAGYSDPFERLGADEWLGCPTCCGFDYVSIAVKAGEDTVAIRFDTGLRAPAASVREVNKLIMLSNIRFRVVGFDPLPAEGGPITFTYTLGNDALGLTADEDAWETLCACDGDDDDDLPEEGAKLLTTTLHLAGKTARDYVPRFNSIIYGGAGALQANRL